MRAINQTLKMKLKTISRGQKRVRNLSPKSSLSRGLHLFLGDEHDIDREEADKLRQFHLVPRKNQPPFPFARKVGFAGCWFDSDQGPKFKIQEKEVFVETFTERLNQSFYLRTDKRGNRKPRHETSYPVETNIALRAGLSRVLADLVRAGEVSFAHSVFLEGAKAGMEVLENRTGYRSSYMAGHPDAEGTLSVHYGLWTVDPIQHELIGRSADGKKGRKGLRTLGHCFRSLLLLDEAVPLPPLCMSRPKKNLSTRDPDDWAALLALNNVVETALSRRPDGLELLAKAKKYQVEAAEDWLRRFQGSSGVDLERKRQQRERQKRAAMKWAAKKEEKLLVEIVQKEEAIQTAINEKIQAEGLISKLKEAQMIADAKMKRFADDLVDQRIKVIGLEVKVKRAQKESEARISYIAKITEVVKKLIPFLDKMRKLIPAETMQLFKELAVLLQLEAFIKLQENPSKEQSNDVHR